MGDLLGTDGVRFNVGTPGTVLGLIQKINIKGKKKRMLSLNITDHCNSVSLHANSAGILWTSSGENNIKFICLHFIERVDS